MILELALSAAVLMGVHGNATLNCVPTRPKDQASMICTCMNPTKNGIEWRIDSVVSTSCLGSSDTCIPPVAGYTSDVSKDEFYAEVSSYTYSNCATYSCKDPTTGDEVPITTSIRDFNSSMPTAITEPGSNKNGTVQITTNCLFKETDIIVKWYTISQTDGTKDYDPETNFSTPTNCTDATKTCNEERAVTLNIGFEHTEKSVGCVKFKLEVYHSADPSDKIELVTTGDYCIKDSTTNSTPLPTGAANATDANNAATTMLQTTTQNNITIADSSQKKIIIIACVVGGIVLLAIVFAFCYYFHYKRQEQKKKEKNKFSAEMHTHEHTSETVN